MSFEDTHDKHYTFESSGPLPSLLNYCRDHVVLGSRLCLTRSEAKGSKM